jgi:hypothetical protein
MVSVPPIPPIKATVQPTPSPPLAGIVGMASPEKTSAVPGQRRIAVTTTLMNMRPMQTPITFSNSRKPPAQTMAKPTRLETIPQKTFPSPAMLKIGTIAFGLICLFLMPDLRSQSQNAYRASHVWLARYAG